MTVHALALALHTLAAVVWVGGMFFAHQVLRPVAVGQLEPPPRLKLWCGVFGRFFPWVWVAVLILPLSGYWLVFKLFGGMQSLGVHIHLMQGLGWAMIMLFMHVYFAPYRRLKEAVITENWPEGGRQLNQIRRIVGINLSIGLIVIAAAAGGRYL